MTADHRWLHSAVAIATLLATSDSARADPVDTDATASVDAAPDVRLQLLAGAATAPFITMDLPRAEGAGAALLLAARMEVRPMLHLGLRVPLALVGVEQPAGSFVMEAAWGNPELFIERAASFSSGTSRPLHARARMAIGAPLAEHGSGGLMENRALAIADALFAWRERELFVPGQLPVTPAGELAMSFDRWSAHAILKLPILVRVSDATPEATANAVGFTPVLGLRARADITSRLEVSGDVAAAFELVRPFRWIDQDSRVQMSVHADLACRITAGVRIVGTVMVPLGGALGGDTVAGGLSVAYTPSR